VKIIRSIAGMRKYSGGARSKGKTVGFVPTMGYLHEGHLSLIRRAKKECDLTVLSIFVNPTQFGPAEDYKKYPRDLKHDEAIARRLGVNAIFLPTVDKMYPPGFCTYVSVEGLSGILCGRSRPGHFRGVATVVSKLFNIVQPDVAYFGQKDAQQAVIIRRFVKDLNMGVKIRVLPIIREKDGLALSSRNKYLSGQERKDALVLYAALRGARRRVLAGERSAKRVVSAIKRLIEEKKGAKIDYVSVVEADSLTEIKRISGKVLIALAVRIGKTRLIDNVIIIKKEGTKAQRHRGTKKKMEIRCG